MTPLQKLRKRMEEAEERARALLRTAAEDAQRAFTEAEQTEYDEAIGEVRTLRASITNLEAARDLGITGAAPTPPTPSDEDLTDEQRAAVLAAQGGAELVTDVPDAVVLDEAERGFPDFSQFLEAVTRACTPGTPADQVDRRLFALNANGGHFGDEVLTRRAAMPAELRAPTGQSTGVPSDGGFLVQKDHNDQLVKKAFDDSVVLSRVTNQPISGNANGYKQEFIDEDSRVDGSRHGGLLAYWAGEADAYTASKAKTYPFEVNVHKLTGLVYLTDESMQDAGALSAAILRDMPAELRWKAESAIWEGNGVGMPLGVQGHAAQVEIAKEGSQAADTVVAGNVYKSWARMFNLLGAAWYINQDVWPQLFSLADANGNSIYLPGGVIAGAPFGTLLGRPIFPWEHAETVGDAGDFNFIDWSQYMFVTKGGIRGDSSIHVRFLNGEQVLRFTWRAGGQPMWRKALTPAKGSSTQSPFLRIAVRT